MSINNCPSCKVSPIVDITVKCRNEDCKLFDEEFLVYDWQKLKPEDKD